MSELGVLRGKAVMLRHVVLRLRGLFSRRRGELELDEELRFHLEMETLANAARGMPDAEARRTASIAFGGLDQTKEAVRDRTAVWYDGLLNSTRLGLRSLFRSPRFYCGVGLMLGVGLAVATTLFNIQDALFFRPLRVPNSARLFVVELVSPDSPANRARVDARAVEDLQNAGIPGIDAFGGIATTQAEGRVHGVAFSAPAAIVTASFFDLVGLQLSLGRGVDGVVVTDHFAQAHLGGSGKAVGTTIIVKDFDGTTLTQFDRRLTVTAVAPRGFHVPGNTDLWYQQRPGRVRAKTQELWALVSPGAWAIDEWQLRGVQTSGALGPSTGQIRARSLRAALTGEAAPAMFVLLAAVIGVLGIAWAHAVSLLGSRFYSHRHTVATKVALGASISRLVMESGIEATILGLISVITSQPLATWTTRWFAGMLPFTRQRHVVHGLMGLVFSLALTFAFLLLYTLLVRWVVHREVSSGATTARLRPHSVRSERTGAVLSACSYALAIAFVYAAAVLWSSYQRTYHEDFGFSTNRLVGVTVVPPPMFWSTVQGQARLQGTLDAIERSARRLPAVAEVARVNGAPFGTGGTEWRVQVTGTDATGTRREAIASMRAVGPRYFRTINVPVLAGRDLDDNDLIATDPAVLVNATLARTLWPTGGAIGRYLDRDHTSYRVAGVCADFRDNNRSVGIAPQAFVLEPATSWDFVLRLRSKEPGLLDRIEKLIRSVEPNLGVRVFSYDAVRRRLSATERAYTLFMLIVVLAAVLISAFGVYVAVSDSVASNARHLGVHLALGAPVSAAVGYVSSRVLRWVASGCVLGIFGGICAAILLRTMVRHIAWFEPLAIVACVLVGALSVGAALAGPVKRIRALDVADVLRQE